MAITTTNTTALVAAIGILMRNLLQRITRRAIRPMLIRGMAKPPMSNQHMSNQHMPNPHMAIRHIPMLTMGTLIMDTLTARRERPAPSRERASIATHSPIMGGKSASARLRSGSASSVSSLWQPGRV